MPQLVSVVALLLLLYVGLSLLLSHPLVVPLCLLLTLLVSHPLLSSLSLVLMLRRRLLQLLYQQLVAVIIFP